MGDYTRLSAFDQCFLDIEDRQTHMHVAGTCIFDASPLTNASGGIDLDRVLRYIDGRLASVPRYRQRLAYAPGGGQAVWVDDYRFNLRHHVRHVSLPRPGTDAQLKRVLGWLNSQQLDRNRPLWEMWVIEGLEGNRFAIHQKVHHAMIDGLAGAEELAVLLSANSNDAIALPRPWQARPEPSALALLRDSALRRASLPVVAAREAGRALLSEPRATVQSAARRIVGVAAVIGNGLARTAETRLNRPIGAERSFDMLTMDLERAKIVKNRLGGTVNDVMLAAVAGALRRYLQSDGASAEDIENLKLRALCPVNRRTEAGRSTVGNKVAGMLVELPVGEADPRECYASVRLASATAKRSHQPDGTEAIGILSDWSSPALIRVIEQLAPRHRVYNLIVTNIPGPNVPLYMLGARLLEVYPMVPLFPCQGLAIALMSYAGTLHWGFNADRGLLPDLAAFVDGVRKSFEDLVAFAETIPELPSVAAETQRTAMQRA
jgi:WS/DGAT/MGAT family acyltransferase